MLDEDRKLKVETICGKRRLSIAASEIVRATATPQVLVSSRRYLARPAAVTRIVGPRFREIASTQEPQPEAVAGTSARSQLVEQAELAPYIFWNDSQDFGAGSTQGPSLMVPEPPRADGMAETELADEVQPQVAATAPEADSLNDRSEDFKASGGAPGGGRGRIPWLDWMVGLQ